MRPIFFQIIAILFLLSMPLLSGCSWMRTSIMNPIDQAHLLTAKAETAYDNHDLHRAEQMYQKAIETNPRDGDIHRKLAELLITQGRIPEAIKHLNDAVERSPDDPETQYQLGKLLYEQGELSSALESLDQTLQIDPAHIDGLSLRAKIALLENDEATAISTYHRILTVSPENVPARINMAELQLKHGHPERAAPILRNICECNFASNDVKTDAYWKLGETYARMQRWDDAVDSYQIAQNHRPSENADDWFSVAFANYQAGHPVQAATAVQQALHLNSDHSHAQALSNTLAQQRLRDAAVQQTAGQPIRFAQ
ncbi:tetratricopeptide repeat protein [Polystyrenella longa]|nr:tetratricopeptide repeat protein [Polystyrenella longa]